MPPDRGKRLETLRPNLLYLWIAITANLDDTVANRLQPILTADEQNEARRFRQATDQNQYIIARALVRYALSHHFPVFPGDWRFDRDHNRKPVIAAPEVSPAIHFSLSHTEGLVACLISLSAEAAVDVEKIKCTQDLTLVARQVLSSAELKALNALSGNDWTTRFFDYWTLKEAYSKARGLGLSLTFRDIDYELDPSNKIRAQFASRVNDDPSAWVFWRRHILRQHSISVAAKRNLGDGCEIVPLSAKFDGTKIVLGA